MIRWWWAWWYLFFTWVDALHAPSLVAVGNLAPGRKYCEIFIIPNQFHHNHHQVIIIIMVNSSRLAPDSFLLRRLLSPPFPPVLIILLLYNLKLLQCIYLFFLFSFSGKSHWFDRPDINTPGHQCMGNIPSENRLIENGLSENRPSKNEWMLFIMKWSKSFSMPPRIC